MLNKALLVAGSKSATQGVNKMFHLEGLSQSGHQHERNTSRGPKVRVQRQGYNEGWAQFGVQRHG